jgi:hypothetical protein
MRNDVADVAEMMLLLNCVALTSAFQQHGSPSCGVLTLHGFSADDRIYVLLEPS